VSRCLQSQVPSRNPTLGVLIASLPELAPFLPSQSQHQQPLLVYIDAPLLAFARVVNDVVRICVALDFEPQGLDQALRHLFEHYPDVAGRIENTQEARLSANEVSFLLNIEEPGNRERSPDHISFLIPNVSQNMHYGYWLRPSVVDVQGERVPTPLMTWWLILYGLSMLARYYPTEWIAALDPDSSEVAVLLDQCMSEAMRRVPMLMLDAIAAAERSFADVDK